MSLFVWKCWITKKENTINLLKNPTFTRSSEELSSLHHDSLEALNKTKSLRYPINCDIVNVRSQDVNSFLSLFTRLCLVWHVGFIFFLCVLFQNGAIFQVISYVAYWLLTDPSSRNPRTGYSTGVNKRAVRVCWQPEADHVDTDLEGNVGVIKLYIYWHPQVKQ